MKGVVSSPRHIDTMEKIRDEVLSVLNGEVPKSLKEAVRGVCDREIDIAVNRGGGQGNNTLG